jgi:uncharacterized membrane protein required for colicin V production
MNNIATLDIIFFTTTLLIVIVATYRGIIKEFFSLINWTFSFALSYLLSPFIAKMLVNTMESKLILNVTVRVAIFMISFLVFMLSTSRFVEDLTFSINVYFNKLLGMVYGVFKSILIFGLMFSLYNCFFDYALGQKLINKNANKMPNWFVYSYSSSIISFSGDVVDPVVKGFIGFLKFNYSDVIKIDKTIETKYKYETIDDLANPSNFPENQLQLNDSKPDNSSNMNNNNNQPNKNFKTIQNNQEKKSVNIKNKEDNNGYNKQDIQKLQKLIEIIN